MENPNPNPNPNPTGSNHSLTTRSLSKHSSHISMSDTESQLSHMDSFHSPLRSDSPVRSDDPIPPTQKPISSSKAMVAFDKYYSPLRSPHKPSSENLSLPPTPSPIGGDPSPAVWYNRTIMEEGIHGVAKGGGQRGEEEVGGERRSRAAVASILRRSKKEVLAMRAALGFRVCELVFCLVSFSVMAADKTQGWSGDSFYRYKEYRYCVAVNVIGFVYGGFQTFDLAYHLVSGKHVISQPLRYYFDFLMDQIMAYLLMSASSSSATRVDDWVSNWGKDEFTEMATASIGMSFLAFIAFALSSLISGYNLCNRDST